MEQEQIQLIQQHLQTKTLSDIKTLCKSGIPQLLRKDIYNLLIQPKQHIKKLSELKQLDEQLLNQHNEIKTIVSVDKTLVHFITQNIMTRYTIVLSNRNYEQIFQMVSVLVSLKPFEYQNLQLNKFSDIKTEKLNDKTNELKEQNESNEVKENETKEMKENQNEDSEKQKEKEYEMNIIETMNFIISFYEKYFKHILTHYPSVQTAISSIFNQLLYFHCPQLVIAIESQRIHLHQYMNQLMGNMLLNTFTNESTLWKLFDYLILSDDPYFYIFVILALFKLKENQLIEMVKKHIENALPNDSINRTNQNETNETENQNEKKENRNEIINENKLHEEITKVINETITIDEMDLLLSIASYLRGHTPLTFFRYITSAITYSINFQKVYSKTLKNSIIVEVNAQDIVKDIVSRNQNTIYIDCRNTEDYERCSIEKSYHITLPINSENIEELKNHFKQHPHAIIVLFGSNLDDHQPSKDIVKASAFTLVKNGIERVCIMENGFEGYHACVAAKQNGAKLERHSVTSCYVCNPQVKRMEQFAKNVEETYEKTKETVKESSSSFWGFISKTVSDTAKKYEEEKAKHYEEDKKRKEEMLKKKQEQQLRDQQIRHQQMKNMMMKQQQMEQKKMNEMKQNEQMKQAKQNEQIQQVKQTQQTKEVKQNEIKQTNQNEQNEKKEKQNEIIEKKEEKQSLFDIVNEEDENEIENNENEENDSDYFNDIMKENPTFFASLQENEESKEIVIVLTSIVMLILEKGDNEMFMLDEINYDDIKKVIMKRSTPDLMTIKTPEKDLIFKMTEKKSEFTQQLAQKMKK